MRFAEHIHREVIDDVPHRHTVFTIPKLKRSAWAACIKRIYEIDAFECPKCKTQKRIIAFIQDAPPTLVHPTFQKHAK